MAAVVVEGENRVVGHDVLVAEEQPVETDSVREHELVVRVPLVLGIDPHLVETHPCRRGILTVISVCKTYCFRLRLSHKILETAVTVISGSVPHI